MLILKIVLSSWEKQSPTLIPILLKKPIKFSVIERTLKTSSLQPPPHYLDLLVCLEKKVTKTSSPFNDGLIHGDESHGIESV